MAPEYEDTPAADTDISGDPQPPAARTPGDISGAAKKAVHGKPPPGQKPKQGGGENPLQALGQEAGQAAQGAEQAIGQAEADRPFKDTGAMPFEGWNPVDWGKQVVNNAETVYSLSRRAYQNWMGLTDPNRVRTSIHHVFGGDTALDDAIQGGLLAADQVAAFMSPGGGVEMMKQGGQGVLDAAGQVTKMLQGQETGQQFTQHEQAHAEQQTEQQMADVPRTVLDPMNYLPPEGRVGQALMIAAPIAQAALSQDPNERNQAMLWSALAAGLFSMGHISPAAQDALRKTFGDAWPAMQQRLEETLNLRKQANRQMADPEQMAQATKQAIDRELAKGAMPEEFTGKPAAKARKPGEVRTIEAEVTDQGAIKLKADQEKVKLQKALQRIGVADVDELIHKAQTEGITDPKQIKAITDNWKALGLPYDLQRWHPEETPLRDPRRLLDSVGDKQAGQRHVSAVNHYLDQIHRGLFANHSDPMTAVLRALAGHSRTTRLINEQFLASVTRLLEPTGLLTQEGQTRMMKAAEGDQAVYDALPDQAKMVIDSWGLLRSAARHAAHDTEYAQNFVPDWVPRTDKLAEEMGKGPGRPSSSSVLARESRRHREEALTATPGGQLVLGQRFKTVQEANDALRQARSELEAKILLAEDMRSRELENDPEVAAIRRDLAEGRGSFEDARARARSLAQAKYPDKETNFLKNVQRTFSYQVRAVHTYQALDELTKMLGKDGRAAALRPMSARQREEFLRQGYRELGDNRFRSFVFHPDVADHLGRYVSHMAQGVGQDSKLMQTALGLEGKIVGGIMYSPVIHGMNMAGRFGMAMLMHPLQMANYLRRGKAIAPHMWDDTSWALRNEAYNAGVVPHFSNQNWADNLISKMQDEFGDEEDTMPRTSKPDTLKTRMQTLIEKAARPQQRVNNYFWGLVNDFGVQMYHVERAAAERSGMAEASAMEYAARRANSWMGMVAAEDKNPQLHNLARLATFAPNWWRTWAELMVPIYRRAGFTQDSAYAKHAAAQGAKTMLAALAFQKMSGNALNYALSGHFQNENQPGQQDRLEISRPEILHGLQSLGVIPSNQADPQYVDPQTGVNPKTGAHYVMENPLGRFQYDVEGAAGLQSGQPDWQVSDLQDGLAKFAAGRLSPLMSAGSALMNVDLYHTMTDGSLRAINPQQPVARPSIAGLLYGTMMMTPAGLNFSQQVQNQAAQGQQNPVQSVLGTQVPTSLQQLVADAKDPAERTVFSGLTGINPAYSQAQKTRGQKPTDQDYQKASQYQQQYAQEMQTLSAQALSGQMTPAQWKQAYHDLSLQHSAQMEALYKNSPEYVHGSSGMLADWENLYQQATNPQTGQVDFDKLNVLQQQFTQAHTQEQMQGMNALLGQNDTKYPMLALYHRTFQAYDQWQQGWASQNNVDLNQLRKEISEYGTLYGDRRASAEYLGQHRDLAMYERAKQREWDRSEAGVLYALFYSNTSNTVRYLGSRRMTQSQLVTQASQQPKLQTPAA